MLTCLHRRKCVLYHSHPHPVKSANRCCAYRFRCAPPASAHRACPAVNLAIAGRTRYSIINVRPATSQPALQRIPGQAFRHPRPRCHGTRLAARSPDLTHCVTNPEVYHSRTHNANPKDPVCNSLLNVLHPLPVLALRLSPRRSPGRTSGLRPRTSGYPSTRLACPAGPQMLPATPPSQTKLCTRHKRTLYHHPPTPSNPPGRNLHSVSHTPETGDWRLKTGATMRPPERSPSPLLTAHCRLSPCRISLRC